MEINSRVNYPIKACLIEMEEMGMIQMDSLTKYCVSWFAIRVANVGTTIAVESWNQHTLRGKLFSVIYNESVCMICYLHY